MTKRHTPEQIKQILQTVDARINGGETVAEVCPELDISPATYYLWRKAYGQMTVHQLERFQALHRRNAQLEREVRALSLDNAILQEALRFQRLTPEQKRDIIRHVRATLQVSERQACAALSQPRCTQRYRPQQET
jgi:putative transposase